MSEIDDRVEDPYLGGALPKAGYLRDYIEYGCEISMSPAEYHLAAGLGQIAAMLGNRVVFPLGGRDYPPHLWIVLLGPAGAKKSTALSLASGLLDQATPESLHMAQETSREALWEMLAKRPTGYMVLSEFLAFLAKSSRDYMAGLKEDLCEVWDSPATMEKALKSGTTILRRPAVTIMGAAVPAALGEWVKHRDLSGGFLSRFLFIPQTTTIVYKGMEDHWTPARNRLVKTLHGLWESLPPANKGQRVKFSKEAVRRWEEFDREMTSLPTPKELSGFAGRCGTYALKVAICYAFAATGQMDPTPEHVDQACSFVEYSRRQVWAMLDEMDPSRDAFDLRRFQEHMVVLAGGNGSWVRARDILRRLHVIRRRFDELASTLQDSGLIERRMVKTDGRPAEEMRFAGRLRVALSPTEGGTQGVTKAYGSSGPSVTPSTVTGQKGSEDGIRHPSGKGSMTEENGLSPVEIPLLSTVTHTHTQSDTREDTRKERSKEVAGNVTEPKEALDG